MVERGLRAAGHRDRPLHLAASRSHRGARRHRRRSRSIAADLRRGHRRRARRRRSRCGATARSTVAADVLRGVDGDRLRDLPARRGRRRGDRGRPGRPLRRHQRHDARRSPPSPRSPSITSGISAHTLAADRVREGRHRQARRAAGRSGGCRGEAAASRSPKVRRASVGSADSFDAHATDHAIADAIRRSTLGLRGPAPARQRRGRGGDPRALVDARRPRLDRGDRHRPDRRASGRRGSSGCACAAGRRACCIDAAHNPAGAARAGVVSAGHRQPSSCRSSSRRWPTRTLNGMIAALAPVASAFIATDGAARAGARRGSAGGARFARWRRDRRSTRVAIAGRGGRRARSNARAARVASPARST